MQLAAVEARRTRGHDHRQGEITEFPWIHTLDTPLEAATNHNNWTSCEKVVHLFAVLQGQGSFVLHNVPTRGTYEDIV